MGNIEHSSVNNVSNRRSKMYQLEEIMDKIQTGPLHTTVLQEILLAAQRANRETGNIEKWHEIVNILWEHLNKGFEYLDDQLLCGTCYFTCMALTDAQVYHLENSIQMIHQELETHSSTAVAISLMYGIFQSPYLMKHNNHCTSRIKVILESTFQLLVSMAYDYSRYTFMSFKIVSSFKKVIGTCFEDVIFNRQNIVVLLNMLNHNWENPITGVRDLNKIIFKILLSVMDNVSKGDIVREINDFPWNKAKYLKLSEVIEAMGNSGVTKVDSDWPDGIIHSLQKPGLVSAGADMYYSILKNMNSAEEWCNTLLNKVSNVLNGNSRKSIENFCNYWCLTTLKKFPTLMDTLLESINEPFQDELKLFSLFCILKQGNKLGLIEKEMGMREKYQETICSGLDHCSVHIRILAFDIICVSKVNAMPHYSDYDLVINYLFNNINSDSTVLRVNMLTSLNSFLIRIHTIYLNECKTSEGISDTNIKITKFCQDMQHVIASSLNASGNYQRKKTTLKLCDVMFQYFSEIPKKKQQPKTCSFSLIQDLIQKGFWILSEEIFTKKLISLLHDPADDVRDTVAQILFKYYYEYLIQPQIYSNLALNAMDRIKGKFFYEINCGHSLFKVILNIVKRSPQRHHQFSSVDDVFDYAYDQLTSEYNSGRNVVKSIEEGKQLHSFIGIISAVLEISLKNNYRINKFDNLLSSNLLETLEGISKQFASEKDVCVNSDFSKISDMVQKSIAMSGYDPHNERDASKISGLYQIVLNCMWLNVKESCTLASLLIRYYKEDGNEDTCEKCLNIITNVLETSRHKGAIEGAGVALGQAIQHLSSLPKESVLSKLPLKFLKYKVSQLTSSMASVTRRGAGLSILVHRIVSSDVQKGKPLLHYFINTLLMNCASLEDVPSGILTGSQDIDNEKDLPKAIYIHFLTRIITDSSLASDVMFYSARLAELAFSNLTNKHWQIRNAALQLYGALIPKLIGQNKQSGMQEETIATVACDEFRTHSRALWKHMLKHLEVTNNPDDVQRHSDLVPILNLLSNCAQRYNFSCDHTVDRDYELKLFQNCMKLLRSPIHTVRRLTAKCIFNIFPYKLVHDALINQTITSENELHGSLQVIELYYRNNSMPEREFDNILRLFERILNERPHSYFCRTIFEDMYSPGGIAEIEKAYLEFNKNRCHPGIFLWLKSRIARCLRDCDLEEVPKIIEILQKKEYIEGCYEYIEPKMDTIQNIPSKTLIKIYECLMKYYKKFDTSIVWKIVYKISLQVELNSDKDVTDYLKSSNYNITYKTRYLLPFLVRTVKDDNDLLLKLSHVIFSLSDPESTDCDMRRMAALANNEFGNRLVTLPDEVKIQAIKTAVVLVQDEDVEIRDLSVNFYRNVTQSFYPLNPYICLDKLLNWDFLRSVLNESKTSKHTLCSELTAFLNTFSKEQADDDTYNPFTNTSKNIYIENELILCKIKSL